MSLRKKMDKFKVLAKKSMLQVLNAAFVIGANIVYLTARGVSSGLSIFMVIGDIVIISCSFYLVWLAIHEWNELSEDIDITIDDLADAAISRNDPDLAEQLGIRLTSEEEGTIAQNCRS